MRKLGLLLSSWSVAVGLVTIAALTAATGWSGAAVGQTAQPSAAEFAARGAESCLRCHDKPPATSILLTPHAVKGDARTPFAAHACESCHGASPEHMRAPEGSKRPAPAMAFGKKSKNNVADQNAVCLNCHSGAARINWKGSPHHSNDVSCASCHNLHTTADRVLARKTQPAVCYECHKEQRAQTLRRSHHPINEGLVTCSECHNPHGSPQRKLLVGMTVNDTCYGCHAEKRGPFLWEHAPVREDCSICHVPHGANETRLLKQRAPFMCQQCHMASAHPSTLYSAANIPPTAGHQLLAKACLNCHSQVHGSNHPSGTRFMR